jgi:hypothetical protein
VGIVCLSEALVQTLNAPTLDFAHAFLLRAALPLILCRLCFQGRFLTAGCQPAKLILLVGRITPIV